MAAKDTKTTKSTTWTMSMALDLIKAMQPFTRPYGFHMMLGGSVLNNGTSNKDLDLYFIPLDNGGHAKDVELLTWLASKFGKGTSIGPSSGYPSNEIDRNTGGWKMNKVYRHKMFFDYDGLRIDCFIV